MSVNLWNLWRSSGFLLIVSIYLVHRISSIEIDLVSDLSRLPMSSSMIHHSSVWSLDLTRNKGNTFLSQSATEKILRILAANKGFSLCVTLSQNIFNSGTIFSIIYQGTKRFLDIKVSLKRKVVKVLYFPDWRTHGYITEKLPFVPTNDTLTPLCIEYVNSARELSLKIECKTAIKVKLRENIPFKSFETKNKDEFKIWIGQRGSNQGLFKGVMDNMIFSDNSRHSAVYCIPLTQSSTPTLITVSRFTQNDVAPDRVSILETELALMKAELAAVQKYLNGVKQCQCFPQCTTSDGHIKSYSDSWKETPCHNCTCTLQGKVCHQQTCATLSCAKNITDVDHCCPRCPYTCQYQKKKYPHDQGFSINCMECHCNDGTLSCRRINPDMQCPKLNCPKFLQVKPKGQCCKKCKAFNMCELAKCGPNASCKESSATFIGCHCHAGYQGNPYNGCEDIDECLLANRCPSTSNCVNTKGSYKCVCKPGFTSVNGSTGKCAATCSKNPCQNNSTCIGPDQCECNAGFTGPRCNLDIDECRLGLIKCPLNSECVNSPGGYVCQCRAGYRSIGTEDISISYDNQCVDTNECLGTRGVQFHCDSSSLCVNIPGGYRCIPKAEGSQLFGSNCAIQNKDGDITLIYDNRNVNITETCKTCRCQSGILSCEEMACDCSSAGAPSACCPICSQNRCPVKDETHLQTVEQNWLNCSLTISNCTILRCPFLKCTDQIMLPGQCCKYCRSSSLASCTMAYNNLHAIVPALVEYMSKCHINGLAYKSGENIVSHKYQDGGCLKCLCWDGHLCCGKSFHCPDKGSSK